jgi:subtilisin family serine protease
VSDSDRVTAKDIEWAGAFDEGRLQPTAALPLPGEAREWAIGGATGRGVKVAVMDSGVDGTHPWVGGLAGSVVVEADGDDVRYVDGDHEDLVGHGTACAGIIRSLAPDVELHSIRVLGPNLKTRGWLFLAAIQWAVENGMHVVNMSLSSSSQEWFADLHEIADDAYFRNTMLVCAANNRPGPTYPSQFSSVISVAAQAGVDPRSVAYNTNPPVEFGALGVDIEVAWTGGKTITGTGNSYATPHVAGLVALMLSKHPEMTPFQVKATLQAMATNAR